MSAPVEKVLKYGHTRLREINFIHEVVDDWMQANGIGSWEDVAYGREYDGCAHHNVELRDGATKLVLVPNGKDYVIKIPFIGEDNWDDGVNYFTGGMEYSEEPFDYCAAECAMYEEAMFYECAQFLVPTVYIDTINEVPIYIQTRIMGIRTERPSDENTYKYASIENSDMLDPEVGGKLMEYYTVEEVTKFLAFIVDNDINDLEASRNGSYVMDFGRYVFWDYSGYKEC